MNLLPALILRRGQLNSAAVWLVFVASLLAAVGLADAQTLPASLQSEFEAGVAALEAGHLDEAERDFLHVLREQGKASFVYNNLGIVYQMRGDQARAATQFREAIRLQPDYAAPHILLGASLLAIGGNLEAVRELERAVKIDPHQPQARAELAEAYKRMGNYQGLIEQYQALHSMQPADPEYLYQLGHAYFDQAQRCLTEIKKIDPNAPCLYQTLGENYRLQGHLDLAITLYERALSIEPKRPGIHLALAEIYLRQGQAAKARKEIDEELAIVPESATAQALARTIAAEEQK